MLLSFFGRCFDLSFVGVIEILSGLFLGCFLVLDFCWYLKNIQKHVFPNVQTKTSMAMFFQFAVYVPLSRIVFLF